MLGAVPSFLSSALKKFVSWRLVYRLMTSGSDGLDGGGELTRCLKFFILVMPDLQSLSR